jgi:hypothetical protein
MVLPGAWRSVSPWAWLGGAFMLLAMPVLAMSAAPVAMIEMVLGYKKSKSSAL